MTPLQRVAAWVVLVVLVLTLAASIGRFTQDFGDWPFPPTDDVGDDFGALALAVSADDNGLAVALLLRAEPTFRSMERLEVPQDLSLLRDFVAYGDRMLSVFYAPVVDDMIAGKLEQVEYDPVMTEDEFEAVIAGRDTRTIGPATLVIGDSPSPVYRLFTDQGRTTYLVVPQEGE